MPKYVIVNEEVVAAAWLLSILLIPASAYLYLKVWLMLLPISVEVYSSLCGLSVESEDMLIQLDGTRSLCWIQLGLGNKEVRKYWR